MPLAVRACSLQLVCSLEPWHSRGEAWLDWVKFLSIPPGQQLCLPLMQASRPRAPAGLDEPAAGHYEYRHPMYVMHHPCVR